MKHSGIDEAKLDRIVAQARRDAERATSATASRR